MSVIMFHFTPELNKINFELNKQTLYPSDVKDISRLKSWLSKYQLSDKYDFEYFRGSSYRCFSIYHIEDNKYKKWVTFYQSNDYSEVKIYYHEKGYIIRLNLKGRLEYLYKHTDSYLHVLLSLLTSGFIPKKSVKKAKRDYKSLNDRILKLISPESDYRHLDDPGENNRFFDKILSETVVKKYVALEEKKDDGSPRNPILFFAYQSDYCLCKGRFTFKISEVRKTYFTYTLTWNDIMLSDKEPLTQTVLSEVLDLIFDRQYHIDE